MEGIIIGILVLLFSIITHEVMHGYMAYKLGDPTAKDDNRLTMNPISHIDPVGTILLPAILIISQSNFFFGWAKPVPFNPAHFKDRKLGTMLVAAAGPGSNLALALFAVLIFRLFSTSLPIVFLQFLVMLCMTNMFLAAFNLIPIPPLDGSRIAAWFMPDNILREYAKLERFGMIIVLILVMTGGIGPFMSMVSNLSLAMLGLR